MEDYLLFLIYNNFTSKPLQAIILRNFCFLEGLHFLCSDNAVKDFVRMKFLTVCREHN